MSNNTVITGLNTTLANAIVSYQKLHHYHWQVNGEQFFELHTKFEEYYDKFAVIIDDVAERILTIGGSPLGTLSEALSTATISEDSEFPKATEMVSRTLNDFSTQTEQIQGVIAKAESAGDRGTVNLLDGIADGLEKDMWMLKAFLKKAGAAAEKNAA
ncbi:DNA starvation/stationary phase protection protein [candidate division GN15 bacterium]|nr:DNA starvation/stationary phase protection protein [candidate division GN15 bacterium]